MRRQTKKLSKEVECIELSPFEYQRIDDFYKESLLNDGVPFAVVKNTNINKLILTNGIYRKEFIIEVLKEDDNITPQQREDEAKERREYLEQLDNNQTDAEVDYAERMDNTSIRNPLLKE